MATALKASASESSHTDMRIPQYYGFAASVLPFCNLLETQNGTAPAAEGGVVSVWGVERALDAFLAAVAELDYDAIEGDPDDPVQDRSWMWQYCTEYGAHSPPTVCPHGAS